MFCQQRALEGHCRRKGASPSSCVLGLAFSCSCCLSGQQCECVGTFSGFPHGASVTSVPQPRPGDYFSIAFLTHTPWALHFMPTMVSQIPVCSHVTALACSNPRNCFLPAQKLDLLDLGQPSKLHCHPMSLPIRSPMRSDPQAWEGPISSLFFLLTFSVSLFVTLLSYLNNSLY